MDSKYFPTKLSHSEFRETIRTIMKESGFTERETPPDSPDGERARLKVTMVPKSAPKGQSDVVTGDVLPEPGT
jgi:hypothetical protein